MYKESKRTEEPCTEIELPHKIQANFATRVHNNLVRLLHRRSLKKIEQPKPGDARPPAPAPGGAQHKLIERLRVEEGLSSRKPLGNQLTLAARPPGDPYKDISISAPPVRRGSLFMFPKFKPDVPVLAQKMTHLSMNAMAATRRSSTSTAFVKDTIANPNRSELLVCIAHALYYHMSTGMQTKVKIHEDIFSEKLHPMTREKPNFSKMPPMDTVYNFIRCLHEHAKSDHEVIIMSLAYIERLLEMSKITFDATNWRRITLAAFIVADKAWNDLAVWNEDFLALFKGFVKIRDLNALEMKFLNLIQFKIFLKSSMYTKYYFELKAFSGMTNDQKMIALAPLAPSKAEIQKDAAAKLIARQNRRSMSLDAYRPAKSKTIMVLN